MTTTRNDSGIWFFVLAVFCVLILLGEVRNYYALRESPDRLPDRWHPESVLGRLHSLEYDVEALKREAEEASQ